MISNNPGSNKELACLLRAVLIHPLTPVSLQDAITDTLMAASSHTDLFTASGLELYLEGWQRKSDIEQGQRIEGQPEAAYAG